jgi:hypothetical protein
LLAANEAFLATCHLPSVGDAGQVIILPECPLHGDDLFKLGLISEKELREREEKLKMKSKMCDFFAGLQTGIVIGD